MKIITKLTLSFLIVSLLVLLMGYFSAHKSQEILQKTIGNNSVMLAQNIMREIDIYINNRIEEMEIYSHDPALQKTVSESNREFERLENVQEYIDEKDRNWVGAPNSAANHHIQELMSNGLSEKLITNIKAYEHKYGYRVFSEVFITNRFGVVIALSGRTSDYYQADEKWWQEAKKHSLYVNDVVYDESAGVYSIDICIDIHDDKGNFLGVLKAVLNIRDIINSVATQMGITKVGRITAEHEAYGQQGHATMDFNLLTGDRKILYSTEEFELLENVSEELLTNIKNKSEQNYFISDGNISREGTKLFAYAHSRGYQNYKGLGWISVIEHETAEIFTPIMDLKNTLMMSTFFVTGFALIFGGFMSYSISRPITELKDATDKVSSGDWNTRIKIRSKDETGRLAESFIRMTKKLKTSRDEMLSAKDYTESIVSSMIDPLITVNPNTIIKFVNKATCDLLGYSCEELAGESIAIIFAEEAIGEEEQKNLNSIRELIEKGSVKNMEIQLKAKSGEKISVNLSGSALRKGEISGAVIVLRDMREINKLMENEKELTLKATITADSERNRAAELDEAYKNLAEVNEDLKETTIQAIQNEKLTALGEMTAGIAHELNQPLNGMKIICQDILRDIEKDRFDQDTLTDDLKEVVGEVDRMSKIIDHMRLFSRRSIEEDAGPININEAVEGVFKILGQQLHIHNINVKKDFAPDLPNVLIDQIKVEQVFINIINNARHALEESGNKDMTIEIKSFLEESEEGSNVIVSIRDNAGGMPESVRERIFEPFYTTKRPGKGTGLGLSVSKKIIDTAGGRIEVSVEEGIGSTFQLIFPEHEASEEA